MNRLTMNTHDVLCWDARFFMIAGVFMLINTVMLWARFYLDHQLSILWPAIPAVIGLAAGVFGLFKLYTPAVNNAPFMAKSGVSFAFLACFSLGSAAIWLFGMSLLYGAVPQPTPQWFTLLIVIFMVAVVLAFLCYAIAFLRCEALRNIGCLLSLPVAMWALMLVVGSIKGMEAGLSLDYYTNAVISVTFLALGFSLRKDGCVKA